MKQISAGEYRQHTGKYQDMAQSEPITITKHDRPSLVLLSFAQYQRLTGQTRRAMPVSELSTEDLQAILNSKMPTELDHLNEELED